MKTLLNIPKKHITHHNDKGRVCNYLKNNSNLVGIIDEDPGKAQPTYLKNLKEISNISGVKIYSDHAGNKLVVLCPALEGWIIKCAHSSKIDMIKEFGLADTEKSLHSEINWKLHKLERLVIHLIEIKNKGILHLREALNQ
ncbi:MAG TPA: hypothetical protein VEC12_15895 [Bacteroidia bacterium]|nr:hypothetical protein [Bacteroidia bacterium]